MIALYILLGVLALLLLLLLVPVRVWVTHRDGWKICLWVLLIPIPLYPRKKRTKKKPEKEPARASRKKTARKAGKSSSGKKTKGPLTEMGNLLRQEGIGSTLEYLTDLLRLGKRTVDWTLDAVTIDRLYADIRLAGEDAAETATNYGKISALVYTAQSLLETRMRVRRRRVRVVPDFCGRNRIFRWKSVFM